ncbi:MAG: sugar phosphate isomerase/epimerase [Solobacterium sp.]|nr:sugar phosphate isomerase/epimerase [Solobacterium sp.]
MEKMKAGFIGFVPRGVQGEEWFKIIGEYAAIGYKAFEHGSPLLNGDVEANLARVKAMGIQPLVMGMFARPGQPAPTLEETAENCHKVGVTRVATYVSVAATYRFGMRKTPPTYDEIMAEIEEFERKATFFKGEGIDFMFHNHDTEIAMKVAGMPILQLMYANTENLKFELDTGWVLYGGGCPVDYIHRYADRISMLHIKDFTDGWVEQPAMPGMDSGGYKKMMPRFTAPGTGKLPLREVLKAGIEEGIEWAVVEQDFMNNLNQKDTLTAAYLNMKETGLIE